MIVEDDDGTTFSFRGSSVKFGTVRINGVPEEEFQKMSKSDEEFLAKDDEAIKDLVGETCRRTSLAIGVYDAMHDATQSWEGEVGGDLAYLMGAILKGEKFEAWLGASDDLMRLLVRAFELDNAVWDYVDLMNDDGDVAFPARIKTGILRAAGAGGMEVGALGNLDVEDYPQAGAWVDVLKVGG